MNPSYVILAFLYLACGYAAIGVRRGTIKPYNLAYAVSMTAFATSLVVIR